MRGYIYKLYCLTSNLVYYGSTTTPLEVRLYGHEHNPTTTSNEIIKNGNYKIECLEEFDFENKSDLRNREKHYIINNVCVNKNVPNRTTKEWYNEKNYKDKLRAEYDDNRRLKKKQYYQANKESRLTYQNAYNNKNKTNNIIQHSIDENTN